MNNLKDTFANSRDLGEFVLGYFNYLNVLQTKLNVTNINDVINCFITAREKGKTIYFAGNGGSAATASHFAQDLGEVGRKANVKSFKTISLADNVSLITAIGNDYGYEKWVEMVIKFYGDKGDILIVISTSGMSKNIINGIYAARKKKFKSIITFTGHIKKNSVSRLGDINMWVDSKAYNIVENIHQTWLLSIVDLIIGKKEYPPN